MINDAWCVFNIIVDGMEEWRLYDHVKPTRFNWIYHDATTFNDYLVGTSFENTLLMGANEKWWCTRLRDFQGTRSISITGNGSQQFGPWN